MRYDKYRSLERHLDRIEGDEPGYAVLFFSSKRCQPCKQAEAEFESVGFGDMLPGGARLFHLKGQSRKNPYEVHSFPTFVFVDNTRTAVAKTSGYAPGHWQAILDGARKIWDLLSGGLCGEPLARALASA